MKGLLTGYFTKAGSKIKTAVGGACTRLYNHYKSNRKRDLLGIGMASIISLLLIYSYIKPYFKPEQEEGQSGKGGVTVTEKIKQQPEYIKSIDDTIAEIEKQQNTLSDEIQGFKEYLIRGNVYDEKVQKEIKRLTKEQKGIDKGIRRLTERVEDEDYGRQTMDELEGLSRSLGGSYKKLSELEKRVDKAEKEKEYKSQEKIIEKELKKKGVEVAKQPAEEVKPIEKAKPTLLLETTTKRGSITVSREEDNCIYRTKSKEGELTSYSTSCKDPNTIYRQVWTATTK